MNRMRKMRAIAMAASVAGSLLLPGAVRSEGRHEAVSEIIHSNVPLYDLAWDGLWPRSMSSDEEIGCISDVGFGDWRFEPADANEDEKGSWHRFAHYGVFHCAAIMSAADERSELETARWEYGFFVRLGKARHRAADWELWALQEGTRTGSNYTLLARPAAKGGLITEFQVLQQHCPRDRMVESRRLDIFPTRYCAINSRTELLSLARAMLRRPVLGTMSRVSGPDGD